MKLTKYDHAALTIEKDDEVLVIDPGNFLSLTEFPGVVGVVITHEHADHWTPENLQRILHDSPQAELVGPAGVVKAAEAFPVALAKAGDEVQLGSFRLRFFGGQHAVIHSSIPVVDNLGVLVDDGFYYPGDSFTIPEGVEIGTLAAPVGAPWLKISEAMDFVLATRPRQAFATHDMTLSVFGKRLGADRLGWATEQGGGIWRNLEPGDSIEV